MPRSATPPLTSQESCRSCHCTELRLSQSECSASYEFSRYSSLGIIMDDPVCALATTFIVGSLSNVATILYCVLDTRMAPSTALTVDMSDSLKKHTESRQFSFFECAASSQAAHGTKASCSACQLTMIRHANHTCSRIPRPRPSLLAAHVQSHHRSGTNARADHLITCPW